MNNNIDFDLLIKNLEDDTNLLDDVGSIENLGFSKDQVRFINLLIERALREYSKQLFS